MSGLWRSMGGPFQTRAPGGVGTVSEMGDCEFTARVAEFEKSESSSSLGEATRLNPEPYRQP